ncbi:unnamed protein product [Dibothriocephalus latus]|uniref:Uncharacterized protein n=1 Tax=Dibothriocephalus latus TaxID=60516 RepID=A0A3P7PSR7_DIBLA|nr:unnamed protein product [Dibothriocephalus latus]
MRAYFVASAISDDEILCEFEKEEEEERSPGEDFSMKAIFRSTSTTDTLSSRAGVLSGSAATQKMQDLAYQRSYLLPLVKKLVEHLSFFVWKDLH